MSFEIPEELRFLETHEWADRTDGTARVGISEFAQDELGDVVFVEFPEEGSAIGHDEAFGVVESIKAVSDLYSPVAGTVNATNDALLDAPELVNEDPYGEGWMLEIELDDDSGFEDLLDAEAYREQTE